MAEGMGAMNDMHPLVKDRLHRQRTVFAPGQRIRMNVVPMFLNLFLPLAVFILCDSICSFWLMYKSAGAAWGILYIIYGLCVVAILIARYFKRYDPEPTWFTYVALAVTLAAVTGTVCGMHNFNTYALPYYQTLDLKVISHIDAGKERGQNVMDAGVLYFAHGNALDGTKSWHFKHRSLYCVAPIVSNGAEPETLSYDYWAIGKDCCSVSASDFRCGEFGNPAARSAVRVLNDDELIYYRLAVQQAETLYGIMATHPIFVRWMRDPLDEVHGWYLSAYKLFLFQICCAFVGSLFALTFAACKFSWIGRAASAYETDQYDDPRFRQGGYQRDVQFGRGAGQQGGMYGA